MVLLFSYRPSGDPIEAGFVTVAALLKHSSVWVGGTFRTFRRRYPTCTHLSQLSLYVGPLEWRGVAHIGHVNMGVGLLPGLG